MMTRCRCSEACPVFNDRASLRGMDPERVRRQYCEGDPTQCARYQLRNSPSGPPVPGRMLPTDHAQAEATMAMIAASRAAADEA